MLPFLPIGRAKMQEMMGGGGLSAKINSWQNGGSPIHIGGASLVAESSFGSGTIIFNDACIAQDCLIKQITVNANAANGAAWKFKLYRWDGVNYNMIAEQAITPQAGANTITLNPPILAQMGDVPGLYMPDASNKVSTSSTIGAVIGSHYVSGADVTAPNAFTSVSSRRFLLEVFGNRPYLATTGDSIMAGISNGAANWYSPYAATVGTSPVRPGGEPTSEIPNQIRARIASLQYQNLALGAQTWAWIRSTGIPACVAADPQIILIHCGLNDVKAPRTWEQVMADMDAIRALVPSTVTLLIDEILPATYLSNAEAATVRTWNASYATWCAANNATLVVCHDAMGQIRAGTGQIDDLLTAYDQDGRHLTAAGVDKMAAIIQPYIK